jgi:radical SAM-linked protein
MPRIRIHFSKLGPALFVPHVDLPILFTRAARRAGIAMEYTQGFSPHPRTAFGPPLPVGVIGKSEPAEFWFNDWREESFCGWKDSMPKGFEIASVGEVSGVSLTKLCDAASYIIEPLNETPCDEIARAIESELAELGTLLSISADKAAVSLSVTDLERSGASRMIKSLARASLVSGWRDLAITRTAVGRWDGSESKVIPLAEEI